MSTLRRLPPLISLSLSEPPTATDTVRDDSDNFSQASQTSQAEGHHQPFRFGDPIPSSSSSYAVEHSRSPSGDDLSYSSYNSEDGEHDSNDENSPSPLIFARHKVDRLLDEEIYVDHYYRRRGSLPMAIPRPSGLPAGAGVRDGRTDRGSPSRSPELWTASRSLDSDRYSSTGAQPLNFPVQALSASDPSTKADWALLGVKSQDQPQPFDHQGVFDNINLDYIYSGKDAADSRSETYSFVNPDGNPYACRRPRSFMSYAEDTFAWLIHCDNEKLFSRWTFGKEKEASPTQSQPDDKLTLTTNTGSIRKRGVDVIRRPKADPSLGMAIGSHEIWQFEFSGRFRVDRLAHSADPNASPHQRLHIRHIADGHSMRGVPSIVIHKHSKAFAFSIMRGHYRNSSPGTRSVILFARRVVQEGFTRTKTTSRLATHGLLDDREGESKSGSRKSRKSPGDDGIKKRSKNSHQSKTDLQATKDVKVRPDIPHVLPNVQTVSADLAVSVTFGDADLVDGRESPSDQSTIHASDPPIVDHTTLRNRHAESFGVLDQAFIRAKTLETDNSSFFRRLLHPLPRPPNSTAIQRPVVTEGNYRPPWMVFTPRSKQEELDLAHVKMRNAFQDVGLLPSSRSRKSRRSSRSKTTGTVILDSVPEDSLYMFLPMWPSNTDPHSGSKEEDEAVHTPPPLEKRLYLLVYYVPFLENPEKDKNRSRRKNRAGTSTKLGAIGEFVNGWDDYQKPIHEYHVSAHLLGYNEVRGTGVRLPSDGLAVTGPLSDATKYLPNQETMESGDRGEDGSSYIIGIFRGREKGIRFDPHGLKKLGLCIPVLGADGSPSDSKGDGEGENGGVKTTTTGQDGYPWLPEPTDGLEDPNEVLTLSPIGKAVAELAWAGCMALTSFAPA